MSDLREVRHAIAELLYDRMHDDGSLAPLFIRLAWHVCGTYDRVSKTGGSDGCTMALPTEQADPENAGLAKARDILASVHVKYRHLLSLADTFVLGGYVAIEATGGPAITFATGRRDFTLAEAEKINVGLPGGCPFGDSPHNPESGSRLPAADLGPDPNAAPDAPMHVREKPTIDAVRGVFSRMGFNDRETVALIVLGHQYGRCHPEVSGYEHPWYAFDPTSWNVYLHGLGYLSAYVIGADRYREVTNSTGKRQYQMNFMTEEPFMMLISDMALLWDAEYRSHLEYYDRNRAAFREDAATAFKKLSELGCAERLVPESHPPRDVLM